MEKCSRVSVYTKGNMSVVCSIWAPDRPSIHSPDVGLASNSSRFIIQRTIAYSTDTKKLVADDD